MHGGKNFTFQEVLFWTRRDLLGLSLMSSIPVILYVGLGWTWLGIPWLPVAMLGTAVAFVVGFKNNASYDRLWEARRSWGAIVNATRSWGIMVQDFVIGADPDLTQKEKETLILRHIAWLTAMRFQLREPRTWEAIYKKHNKEYQDKWFKVDEHHQKMEDAIKPFLPEQEWQQLMSFPNKATQIIAWQSAHLKKLHQKGMLDDFRHMEMEKMMVEFFNQQGVSERIKNFPYPRQYATTNLYFIRIFIFLVPFGMLNEFNKLGEYMIWLSIPFSTLVCWFFTTLEKIGEASESPFEGSANDVPITSMSRNLEIELKKMHNMQPVPEPLKPVNNIIL